MTGALTWARVSYRQQRWELIVLAVAILAGAAAMVWFAGILDTMRSANPECLNGLQGQLESPSGPPPLSCQIIIDEWYQVQGSASMLGVFALVGPLGMGAILGAPLVAREIDGGTAQLAWSLSPSRAGWLLRRIAFVAAFAIAGLGLVATASEVLSAAVHPDRNLAEDFAFFGQRGTPVVARGVGALTIGVLVGAIMGRVLPALLVSIVVIGLVFAGLSLGQEAWNRGEATVQPMYDEAGRPLPFDFAALDLGYGLVLSDGEFVTHEEAFEQGVPGELLFDGRGGRYASAAHLEAGRAFGHDARLAIAGERYFGLVVRDSLVWLTVGLLALGASAFVVRRRRPS